MLKDTVTCNVCFTPHLINRASMAQHRLDVLKERGCDSISGLPPSRKDIELANQQRNWGRKEHAGSWRRRGLTQGGAF